MRLLRVFSLPAFIMLTACATAEAQIKGQIADANHCESPADCVDVGGKCPFDCYVFVHRSEADRIKALVEGYHSTCTYSCMSIDSVDCVDNVCQPLYQGVPPKPEEQEGDVGAACATHADCITPMLYLSRSVCPFGSRCIDNTCAVVCPMEEPDRCATNDDCDCDGYAANGDIRCKCIDEACVAVVKERSI